MINYIICSIISFLLGFVFAKFIKIEISIKKNASKQSIAYKKTSNPKINCINQMLSEINKNGQLSINLSGAVLMSLKEISKTPDWDKKLDNETIENLYQIYQRWQRHNKGNNTKAVKISSAGGFHKKKYWEGTLEEYKEALRLGLIDEYTDVEIFEDDKNYRGAWLSIDNDGQVEEYMD